MAGGTNSPFIPKQADRGRDYVRSEEDDISTNSLVLLLYHGVGNDTSKKGGSAPRATD